MMAREDIILVGGTSRVMHEWTALLGKRAMNGMREIALPLGISIVREG